MEKTEDYYALLDKVNYMVEKLSDLHQNKMKCKAGCAQCCLNFDVFPMEFHSIKEKMKAEGFKVPVKEKHNDDDTCVFLKDNFCQIYPYRPIICRTHGLPLLMMNESAEFWELSHCELNFENIEPDFFHEDNSLIMDKINSELFQQNIAFLEANKLNYDQFQLIPLNQLSED